MLSEYSFLCCIARTLHFSMLVQFYLEVLHVLRTQHIMWCVEYYTIVAENKFTKRNWPHSLITNVYFQILHSLSILFIFCNEFIFIV